MSTQTDIITFIKSKSIEFARAVGDSLCVGDIASIENKSFVPDCDDIFDDTPLLRGISYDITRNASVNKHRGSLSFDPPMLAQSKSEPNGKCGCNINDECDIVNDLVSFNFTKLQLKRFNEVINGKFGVHRIWETLTHDVVSIMFEFLNKKDIGMFKCVSKDTNFITNQYCLRYCKWMVNKRNNGDYVLKYIKNFDDMQNINIDTLTWSNKFNGNENWDTIHDIMNTSNDESKNDANDITSDDTWFLNDVNDITSDDVWYLLNEYWFSNKNFVWGTFEKSTSANKRNGEWRVLNNPDSNDRAFHMDIHELNGILGTLRHPMLMKNIVVQSNADNDTKMNDEDHIQSNNKLRAPINIVFDTRNDLESRAGNDAKFFDENENIGDVPEFQKYKVTYWNNADSLETTGIKISGNKIHRNKSKKNNITWVNKEILYCNFLTSTYYGKKLKWEWYNNDTCEFIQYSMDNKHLINQLECNYQSNNLNVFTHKDRTLISLTSLTELKKCLKKRIENPDDIRDFDKTKFFKFNSFYCQMGSIEMIQTGLTKVSRNNYSEYDRQIRRTILAQK